MHIDRPFEVTSISPLLGDEITVVGPDDSRLGQAAAAIVGGVRWDAGRFDLAPNLKVLSRTGIGVDTVDLDEATRRGVQVTNTPDGPTVSTAEHTIALLFAVAKTLQPNQDRLRRQTGDYTAASSATELDGLTLGLLAYGRIARRVARIAEAVGMNVITHDPFLAADGVNGGGSEVAVQLVGFDELLSRSDVLSLHCPLTDDTAQLFDADMFARCKPGVIFINAARGGLVDHDALLAALDSGQIRSAGLDVTDPEPLPGDHPLLHRLDVVVTPHVASSTVVGRQRMLTMAIEQALMALRGETPTHLVNR